MPEHAPLDIESIERATLDAVPARESEEFAGWVLAYDPGTIGRAQSAVPLRHEPCEPSIVAEIARRYEARAMKPKLRLARVDAFAPLRATLERDGWRTSKPTAVEVADAARVAAHPGDAPVAFSALPTPQWADVFLGEGFDPADGASRLETLARARSSVFATVAHGERVVAVGSACYSHGWCGMHGIRTAPAFRGRGLAGSIVAALAREAIARGIGRAYLQVEEGNAPARSLYARAGFAQAWVYEYWSRA